MTPQPGSIFHRALSPRHTHHQFVTLVARRRIVVQEQCTAISQWYVRQEARAGEVALP